MMLFLRLVILGIYAGRKGGRIISKAGTQDRKRSGRALSLILAACAMVGCASSPVQNGAPLKGSNGLSLAPTLQEITPTRRALFDLPPPNRPVAVAVYGFTDQTGQFRQSSVGQSFSSAVTQGSTSVLVRALEDAGKSRWFTIVEREQIGRLMQERRIIHNMRELYLGEKGYDPQVLPSLLFAGVLLEGGIIGYDSNTVTGGIGAGYLGISGRTQYRQDVVTVYLRAVSVRTGEVLTTVTSSQTISSYALGGGAFRYVGFKKLLEAEAGLTLNEPRMMALQQAVEYAVYGLVMEGVELKLWEFQDTGAGWPYVWHYQKERDSSYLPATLTRTKGLSREN